MRSVESEEGNERKGKVGGMDIGKEECKEGERRNRRNVKGAKERGK